MTKTVLEKETNVRCTFPTLFGFCFCRQGNAICDCMRYKAELLD